MKGFPAKGGGPMGPGYAKVKEQVSRIQDDTKVGELRNILGEPDLIEQMADDDRIPERSDKVDDCYPAQVWVYVDPYRPRIHYRFGISRDRVIVIEKRVYAGCKVCSATLISGPICPSCGTENMPVS